MTGTAIAEGTLIAGKYRVERVVATGGMGQVLAAEHTQLHNRVAIKVLLPEFVQNPEAAARFQREARAAARIASPHVCRVFDIGRLENGAPYIVMEFLEGWDLADRLEHHGPLPVDDVIEYMLQACEAIAEAHAAGIIHRDLKPANLFVTVRADGSHLVKVVDFGISKLREGERLAITQGTSILGSPLYMAPEQMRNGEVDARTDIWALGTIMYELLTGKTPFAGRSVPEVCMSILESEPVPIEHFRNDVPDGVLHLIRRCLAKKPEERFANVGDLAASLGPYGDALSSVTVARVARVLDSGSYPAQPAGAAEIVVAAERTLAWRPETGDPSAAGGSAVIASPTGSRHGASAGVSVTNAPEAASTSLRGLLAGALAVLALALVGSIWALMRSGDFPRSERVVYRSGNEMQRALAAPAASADGDAAVASAASQASAEPQPSPPESSGRRSTRPPQPTRRGKPRAPSAPSANEFGGRE